MTSNAYELAGVNIDASNRAKMLMMAAVQSTYGKEVLSGIGAFSGVRLGFFDWRTKDYRPISIDEKVEVLSFAGDITFENENPKHLRRRLDPESGLPLIELDAT